MSKNAPHELRDIFGDPYELIDPEQIPCTEISDSSALCKNPLATIHVLAYNHGPYITEALDSLVNQRCSFEFEILIGEDCSTDNTREICLDYQRRYPDKIRLFISEKNVGLRRNSIRSLKPVRGKYLAFCEGDDYWCDPEKLQKQVDYLEAHPDCGLVCTNYNCYIHDTGQLEERCLQDALSIRQDHREQAGEVFIRNVFCTCTVCCRTHLVLQCWQSDPLIHQSTRFKMGDFPLFYEITYHYPIHYMPEPTAVYRVITESATHSADLNRRKAFLHSVLDVRVYYMEKHPIPPEYAKKVAHRSMPVMLTCCFWGDTFWAGIWPVLKRIYPYSYGWRFWKDAAYLFLWFLFPFLRPLIRRKRG